MTRYMRALVWGTALVISAKAGAMSQDIRGWLVWDDNQEMSFAIARHIARLPPAKKYEARGLVWKYVTDTANQRPANFPYPELNGTTVKLYNMQVLRKHSLDLLTKSIDNPNVQFQSEAGRVQKAIEKFTSDVLMAACKGQPDPPFPVPELEASVVSTAPFELSKVKDVYHGVVVCERGVWAEESGFKEPYEREGAQARAEAEQRRKDRAIAEGRPIPEPIEEPVQEKSGLPWGTILLGLGMIFLTVLAGTLWHRFSSRPR